MLHKTLIQQLHIVSFNKVDALEPGSEDRGGFTLRHHFQDAHQGLEEVLCLLVFKKELNPDMGRLGRLQELDELAQLDQLVLSELQVLELFCDQLEAQLKVPTDQTQRQLRNRVARPSLIQLHEEDVLVGSDSLFISFEELLAELGVDVPGGDRLGQVVYKIRLEVQIFLLLKDQCEF